MGHAEAKRGFLRSCQAGVTFHCAPSIPSPAFRLNYSTPSDEQIEEGVKRLGAVFSLI